uniref:Uncharacterized protein MANES_12G046300 n=1 Tax=Rhizophora mucronata TaxID=61149 RepID=A0A2P2J2P8_RHIMU
MVPIPSSLAFCQLYCQESRDHDKSRHMIVVVERTTVALNPVTINPLEYESFLHLYFFACLWE